MEMFMNTFRVAPNPFTSDNCDSPSAPSPKPQLFTFDTNPYPGSFDSDSLNHEYTMRWDDWEAFEQWLEQESEVNCIEFRRDGTTKGMPHFQKRIRFICSRAGSCDSKKYKKKHPNRQRKLGPKRIGCKCCLTVKTYPGVSTVLAKYVKEHNHPTNEANLPYVRMSKKTRELIAALARKKTSAQEIWTTPTPTCMSKGASLSAAWHHVLKGKFLENRRNRRIDTLLHVLTTSVVKYYELRQRRCLFGFEGKNLEEKKRDEIIKQSQIFASADFKRVGALYAVTSKNNASKVYHVDLRTLKCTCPAFPAVSYCKHLCAAQQLLEGPEAEAREYQAIRDAAQSYTAPDCVDWSDEDGLYLVMPPDTTDLFKVNLEEYNCDCDDYTELSFCEHLAATQRLFGTEDIRSQALSTLDVDRSPAPPPTALLPVPATIRTAPSRPQSRVTNLVQKMERLTGRLRQSSKNLPQQELDMLEAAVDAMLAGTESTSVLPTATFVAPNSKAGWSATQQSMTPGVPAVKTGHKRKDVSEDTDDVFGGGKRSGGKAPKQPRKAPAPPPSGRSKCHLGWSIRIKADGNVGHVLDVGHIAEYGSAALEPTSMTRL
ncbi:hypothetical protein FB45DRAFT_1061608 [Roridomyces roridus]|uniref:SWIM-type domain-containing protein n=1 Tax=Roridomyces roridus TaxID=1738132 RepID=A0AAD7FH82_9AGAR|nr:hypothetical protein FB45DRAFT_1061608 [Roridomyces roridus]